MDYAKIVSSVAIVIFIISAIPQIRKLFKNKTAKDVSLVMSLLITIGNLLMLARAVWIRDFFFSVNYAIQFILWLTIVILVIKYCKYEREFVDDKDRITKKEIILAYPLTWIMMGVLLMVMPPSLCLIAKIYGGWNFSGDGCNASEIFLGIFLPLCIFGGMALMAVSVSIAEHFEEKLEKKFGPLF